MSTSSANGELSSQKLSVKKRNGKLVEFDVNKISWAIQRCQRSVGLENKDKLYNSIHGVLCNLLDYPGLIIPVEDIQDMVQNSLYENGMNAEFVSYSVFREDKAKIRQSRQLTEDVQDKFRESSKYFPNIIQEFQFLDKYSKFNYELNRRETWVETIERCIKYLRYLSKNLLPESVYEEIRLAILNLEVMPSMRLLSVAGEYAIKNPASIYNCSVVGMDCFESFSEIMFLSMSGVGVGFSVEDKYISKLPVIQEQNGKVFEYTVDDTTEAWADTIKIVMKALYDGCDVNVNYDLLRSAGAVLKTKGGRSSGRKPLEDLVNFIRKTIMNAQGRKLTALEIHDIATFIGGSGLSGSFRRSALISLFDRDNEEMLSCKDGDFSDHSPQRWNANNSTVWTLKKGITPEKIRNQMVRMDKSKRGESGIFNEIAVRNTLPSRRKFSIHIRTNPCFSEDTLIHTKSGHFKIKDLVGKSVEIWNGTDWQNVDNFRVTGKDQHLLSIQLYDGSILKVTPYHSMILDDDTRIEAKDLKLGMKLKLSNAPLSHGIHREKGAYLKGFIIADGTNTEGTRPLLNLYSTKYMCESRLINSALEMDIELGYTNTITEVGFGKEQISEKRKHMHGISCREKDSLCKWAKNYKNGLPDSIFSWDLESKLEFIAGIMDGDGSSQDSKNGFMYQISSISKSMLLDLQTLLKTIGVMSKISLNKLAGKKDFNDGYGEYESKDLWRLTISQKSSIELSKKVKFERLVSFSEKNTKYTVKPRWNKVVGINMVEDTHTVYCCTVEGSHSLSITQNIHVGQCGEILIHIIPVEENGGGGQLCNLSSVVSRPTDTKSDLLRKARIASIIGTIQSMATDFIYLRPEWKRICEEERLLGVDLNGIKDNQILVNDDGTFLRKMRQCVLDTNVEFAGILGINVSVCATTTKPSGNSAQLLQSSSGIHARFAPYFIRNIRVNVHSPLYRVLVDAGAPMSPENGQTWDNMTTAVIHFPVKSPENAILVKDENVLDQLEFWKKIKLNYTEHNPSCTIYYKEEELETLIQWVIDNYEIIGGLSFLPQEKGMAKYDNMPYEEIDKETYEKLNSEFPPVDFSKIYLYEFSDLTESAKTLACSAGNCES